MSIIVNFEQISHIALVFPSMILKKYMQVGLIKSRWMFYFYNQNESFNKSGPENLSDFVIYDIVWFI